jgi:type IV secretion system protein VirB9
MKGNTMKYQNLLKKFIVLGLSTGILFACSSNNKPITLKPATQVIQQPDPIYVVNNDAPSENFKLVYGNDPALYAAFNKYVKTGTASNIETNGFDRFAYNPTTQPIINCEPFQETVIHLEPGERFTNITSGDPQNLSYTVGSSGSDTGIETQYVLVKPGSPRMSTNLVIITNKRLYNILIVVGAKKKHITRSLSFWYPQQMLATVNGNIEKKSDLKLSQELMPRLDVSKSNFDYKLDYDSWSKPSWYPVRVFDDGKRTWIEFPKGVDSKNQPTLLIGTDSGSEDKFNTTYYSPFMVVDGVFGSATLISGVGSDQVKVTITNKNYVK